MAQIYFSELNHIAIHAPQRPYLLEPCSDSVEVLQCPICLEFKHKQIIMHPKCSNLFCVECILAAYEANNYKCPMCQEHTWDRTLNPTGFTKVLPIIDRIIDSVHYQCKMCQGKFTFEDALQHHTGCLSLPGRHVPPNSNIPVGGQSDLSFNSLVSNPVPRPADRIINRPNRLIISYFNGQQVVSKFYPKNRTARAVINDIANLTSVEPSDLKLYKFIHTEIDIDTKVESFAQTKGATYLTLYDKLPELKYKTANIILHEEGIDPVQQPEQRETQPAESWDEW